MDDCNSVENMWTSCLLVEAWVVSVTLYHLCPNLFVYYNIHYKVRDRYREMAHLQLITESLLDQKTDSNDD